MIVQEHIKDVMWSTAVGKVAGATQNASGAILHGFVYFSVPKVPNAISERWYVVLDGDPTEYPLGGGEVADRVTVRSLGELAGGESGVEITSVDGVSAVSSILRVITVERVEEKTGYSTQEMDIHMNHLYGKLKSDIDKTDSGLSGKLDETKTELVSRINNTAADLRTYARREAQSAKEWAESNLVLARTELTRDMDTKIATARSDIEGTMDGKVSTAKSEVLTTFENRVITGQWTLVGLDAYEEYPRNILQFTPSNDTWKNPLVAYDGTNQTLKLTTGRSERNRIARFTWTGTIDVGDGFDGYISFMIRNLNSDNLAQTYHYLARTKNIPKETMRFQMSTDLFIKGNDDSAFTTAGVRVAVQKFGGSPVVSLKTGGELMVTVWEGGLGIPEAL